MSSRFVWGMAAVSSIVLVLTVVWIRFVADVSGQNMLGSLVFANAYDKGTEVNKIMIISAEDEVELVQKNSFWHVANQAGYFADFGLIYKFISVLNNSSYVAGFEVSNELFDEKFLHNPAEGKANSGMLIRVFASDVLTDEIVVGLSDETGKYYFARQPESDKIWLVDGDYNIPLRSKDWLFVPMADLDYSMIETVVVDKMSVSRNNREENFYGEHNNVVNVRPLIKGFGGRLAEKVITTSEFMSLQSKIVQQKTIELITFQGMKFVCNFYWLDDGKAYLRIKLSTTPLPMLAVRDYIKDNNMMFDNWYFLLLPEKSHIFKKFRLI